ncbi:hypothetical protein P1X15_06905 [Runella sp. MFBS21]|uniref:leucine-rich repeat domain-containing protein n=1 Tax=Runella sp. MFBS21 TaxID=3034018 RepID=UPI0023F9F039|nr:hypothetical protein [Runella sp. MFBS21]MDF7817317.1 hypothetical protein [Runella sp. MFBS21]
MKSLGTFYGKWVYLGCRRKGCGYIVLAVILNRLFTTNKHRQDMGFNISGIATNINFNNNLIELQKQLGLTLSFIEEINFEKASENWKEEEVCDIYFSEKGTLLFINMDLCVEPWSIENGDTLTFALSETSMAFNLNYCEGRKLRRSFMAMNDSIMSDEGEKLKVEENTSDASEIIWKQLDVVLGKSYWNIEPFEKAHRYKLVSIQRTKVDVNISVEIESKKQNKNTDSTIVAHHSVNIKLIDNDLSALERADTIFNTLISEDDLLVQQSVNALIESDINNYTLSYILNLSCFHRDSKVRKAAKKQLEKYAPSDLLSQVKENWKDSYLKDQEYIHKALYENPAIASAEFLVFSQAIRRNYFLVKPKTGMIPYASMRYGDEIENIFDCYQVQLETISDKIGRLKHITVANFRKQPKLDIIDTIEKLSMLPNLKFLQIADSGLTEIPDSIENLVNLKTLIIEMNPITQFPKAITFPNIEKLDIRGTNIRIIDIYQFPSLKELWLDGKNMLDTMTFQNVTHDFVATSGKFFSETIHKRT